MGFGGSTSAPAAGGGFAAPDLGGPFSFEEGDLVTGQDPAGHWDGWYGNATNVNPGVFGQSVGHIAVAISTTQHQLGAQSVDVNFLGNDQVNDCAIDMVWDFGSVSHFFCRHYFYLTAYPNDKVKFLRFYSSAGDNPYGLEMDNSWGGQLAWVFPNGTNPNALNRIGVGGNPGSAPSLNTWHSIEIELDAANGKARFWYDGVQTTPIPQNGTSVDGNNFIITDGGGTTNRRYHHIWDTINHTNTAVGHCYHDNVALSTQRIGP